MKNEPGTLMRPETLAEGVSRAVVTPLSPTVVWAAETPDQLDAQYEGRVQGFTYAREGHPNAELLARKVAALEGCAGGVVTGSGMAAVMAVLFGLMKTGDHIIGSDQLYGRSLRLMRDDLPRMGIGVSLCDPTDVAAMRAAITPQTRMILVEVVSNPTLRVADMVGIAALAREAGVMLVVDNTFTTPLGYRPFDHGADVVVHSVTKLLAGHSDVTLGWVAARKPDLQRRIYDFAVTTGLTASPFDCWLAERGMHTFGLRFQRAQETAAALAEALAAMAGVARVLYPTRGDHPDAARATEVLNGHGCNMVSFEVTGGRAAANALTRAARGIAFAPTLGDVGTTLSHPASSSHRGLSPEGRAALGITEGFFRVSVGLEDPQALIAEFSGAVAASQAA